MSELSDDEWAALKAALDAARSGNGRPLGDERTVVEGIVWRMRNGAKWRSLPERFGPWWRAAQLHIRWSQAGVWERAVAHLRDAGRGPNLEEVFVDGTSVRAHRAAAGARGGRLSHALGRSRGGFGTKVSAAVDARGRPLVLAIAPGQASELRAAPAVLDALRRLGAIGRMVCDRGYSSAAGRAAIRAAGAQDCVPAQPSHPPVPYSQAAYRRRNAVERAIGHLKDVRVVATRYDKTAASYLGAFQLAAAPRWIEFPNEA